MAMTTADIEDRKSLEIWLNERPEATRHQEAVALAHRAAMRVAPALAQPVLSTSSSQALHVRVLKAAFWRHVIARVAARNITSEIARAADYATSAFNTSKPASAGYDSILTSSAASAAAAASASAFTFAFGSHMATAAIAAAATADFFDHDLGTTARAATVSSMWEEIRSDAQRFENGTVVSDLLNLPLWRKPPRWWESLFRNNPYGLDFPNLGFDMWAKWFEAAAFGKPIFGIHSENIRNALECDIALGSTDGRFNKDFWDRDPASINADIKRWVDEARAEDRHSSTSSKPPLPPESAVGQPNPSVTQFAQGETGLITAIADPLEPAADRAMQDLRELYEEARDKALAAQSLGRNMLGPCHDPLEQVLTYAPEDFALVRVNRLHAKLSSLRDRVYLHEQQMAKPIEDRDLSLVLQEEVAVRLSACVKQFNLVMAFDKRGRELNSLQHGPEARSRAEAINDALRTVVINVGEVGDAGVVNIILGDNDAVKNASRDIHGDQSVVRVAEQNENLAMAVLQVGWRIAREAERQGLAQPTLELVISVAGQHGPKLLEFIQRFDQAFLWLTQHVEAFQILSQLILLLASYHLANKKP